MTLAPGGAIHGGGGAIVPPAITPKAPVTKLDAAAYQAQVASDLSAAAAAAGAAVGLVGPSDTLSTSPPRTGTAPATHYSDVARQTRPLASPETLDPGGGAPSAPPGIIQSSAPTKPDVAWMQSQVAAALDGNLKAAQQLAETSLTPEPDAVAYGSIDVRTSIGTTAQRRSGRANPPPVGNPISPALRQLTWTSRSPASRQAPEPARAHHVETVSARGGDAVFAPAGVSGAAVGASMGAPRARAPVTVGAKGGSHLGDAEGDASDGSLFAILRSYIVAQRRAIETAGVARAAMHAARAKGSPARGTVEGDVRRARVASACERVERTRFRIAIARQRRTWRDETARAVASQKGAR